MNTLVGSSPALVLAAISIFCPNILVQARKISYRID
jgi:hypothetical protein